MNSLLDGEQGAESKPMQILWHENIVAYCPLLENLRRKPISGAYVILIERNMSNR